MSALLLAGLKVGFLVLMWLFILFVINTIRTDLFGRRVSQAELLAVESASQPRARTRQPRARTRPSGRSNIPPSPTKVVITSGRAQGSSASLPGVGGEIFLGRASACELDVDDDYASSRHAKIWRDEVGFVVEDLLSTNGTYVNGQQISQPTRIEIGDVVRIGRSQMQLEG